MSSRRSYVETTTIWIIIQGDHSPGKPGKVTEFQSGQGKWKKGQGKWNQVFFQALNTPKLVFWPRLRPGPRWGSLRTTLPQTP